MPPDNLNHALYLAQMGLCVLLLVAVPLLLAARCRRRRPAAARRWLGLSVSLFIFGAAFLLGEAWMRWVYDQPQNLGPWAARNWYFRHQGVTVWFRGGCAGDLRAGRLAEQEAPVLALGDSIVWGQGVEAGETFPSLLQESLGLPVLPAGKRGWSTVDQLEWLAKTEARPRAVVLSYAFNDIQDALPDLEETFQPLLEDWFRARHREIPLLGRSYLVDAFIYRLRELASQRDYEAWVLASYADETALSRHMEQLGAVAAWCRARGAGLVVCVWPAQGPDPSPAFREMEEGFTRRLGEVTGAPVVALRPALREAGIGDARAYRAGPREGHPGARAHRVAAEELLPALRRILGETPSPAGGRGGAGPPGRPAPPGTAGSAP